MKQPKISAFYVPLQSHYGILNNEVKYSRRRRFKIKEIKNKFWLTRAA